MSLSLTIAIPTKDDVNNLRQCLLGIGRGLADKVVVIDSNSEDGTSSVAREFGAEVVQFQWDGHFPKKRNWYLRTHSPTTTWIMFLDTDEILTDAFKLELANTLPNSNAAGYWLHYSINFMGRELRYGYPLTKLALFRVGAGEYERIDEEEWSTFDMEIHEHPVMTGEVGHIRSKIDHRDFRDISHYVAKHNQYSSWEAQRVVQLERTGYRDVQLTFKQRIKYRLAKSPLAGIVYFLGAYLLLGGFLDGRRGLAFAILKMSYFTQVYCKIIENQRKSHQ